MSNGGVTRVGALRKESRGQATWAYGVNRLGNSCNLLTDVNHLVTVIVLINLAV